MPQIVLAGDSLAVGLARPLLRFLPDLRCVAQDGRRSCDTQHIPKNASMVIISLGTNDADARAPYGWERLYANRLNAIMNAAGKTHCLWLLPPAMEEADREFFVDKCRAIIRETAANIGVKTMEPWPVAAYQAFHDGMLIREDDGIHYTPQGYKLWAEAIVHILHGTPCNSFTRR